MNATTSRYAPYYPDNYDGVDPDEEEEERRLSERHGEAADDAPSPSHRKRGRGGTQQNTTLTEEDAAAAKEFEEKVRRKKARPALTAAELKGERGLVFVRRSFPASVSRFPDARLASKVRGAGARSNELARRLNARTQIDAAARYSRSLMGAYREFGRDLFPSLAVEDVFLKVEELGKKKEVKDYVQIMREEFRKEYLEGIYGGEKADRLLTELQYGLRAMPGLAKLVKGKSGRKLGGGDEGAVMPRIGRAVDEDKYEEGAPEILPPVSCQTRAAVANPYAKSARENDDDAPEDACPESKGAEKTYDAAVDEPMVNAVLAANNPGTCEEEKDEDTNINPASLQLNSATPDTAKGTGANANAKPMLTFSVSGDDGNVVAKVDESIENTDKPTESAIDNLDEAVEKDDIHANETAAVAAKMQDDEEKVVEKVVEIDADVPTESATEKPDEFVEKGDEINAGFVADGLAEPVLEEKDNDVNTGVGINAAEPAELATENQHTDVEKADESNADKPTGPAAEVTEKQDSVIEEAGESNEEVGFVEKEADESEPPLETQETTIPTPIGKEKFASEIARETHGNVLVSKDTQEEKNELPTQEFDGKTQETLTLVESQFDDVAMEYTQDERFSQASAAKEGDDVGESPTQRVDEGDRFSQTQDEHFSLTQDGRFLQSPKDAPPAEKMQGDGCSQEEENTADGRFSQFTQGSSTANGPIFEEDGCREEEDVDGSNNDGSDRLGQTMTTQLSMDY